MYTVDVAGALTMMPLTVALRMPANVPSPLMVMPLVIVTAPKPPGSSTEISPLSAVFEIAPANVLHGAVRLHGFASSPTPETQVLVACALAVEAVIVSTDKIRRSLVRKRIIESLSSELHRWSSRTDRAIFSDFDTAQPPMP